ncbi:hypothetical protein FA95DRAFT_1607251 [Auriscalpium vulgare]|uniref:Uncharacterized protein n=1 Tax=Auriscalpium vulgare TaxID=40419 RepID=A0ACB8RR27_9AGAM|nr:hypothetical protein FA95DRAFT_1607251 [Auriscalpium vulgare]
MSSSENGLAVPHSLPRDATAPFNADHADIILRSADGVDFRAHKLLLSMASPFFQAMFSLPQPNPSSLVPSSDVKKDGLLVLLFSEDEHSVGMMLAYCYPRALCPEPVVNSVEEMKRALHLASKYEIPEMETAVVRRLQAEEDVPQPVRVYMVAWSLGCRKTVVAAARHTLRTPFIAGTDYEELDAVPATALARLVNYRAACVEVLRDCTTNLAWMQPDLDNIQAQCSNEACASDETTVRDLFWKTWWAEYFRDAYQILKDAPNERALTIPEAVASAVSKASQCSDCRVHGTVTAAISVSSLRLSQELGKRLSEVELKTPF